MITRQPMDRTLNQITFGFADAIWYSDGNGNPLVPSRSRLKIRMPSPAQPGTNSRYPEMITTPTTTS